MQNSANQPVTSTCDKKIRQRILQEAIVTMEDSPTTNVPSLEDQKAGLLSAPLESPGNPSTHHRSASIHSSRSDITIIDNHSNVPVLDRKAIVRRRTQIAEVKISRWSCFLGFLFGPRITERAAVATIRGPDIEEEGEDIFDSKGCPWIQSVYVLPSKNAETKAHQQARCTFDTGCLQGNLVSKEFAQKLGYTESDFKPLRSRESNGGTSATGHTHMPEGVLHLTWYHNTSPRLYSDMRFLVSSSQQYELVIGAYSILRHKLISYPNFGIGDGAGTVSFRLASDKKLNKLTEAEAKLTNTLQTLKHNRDKANKAKVKELDAEIEKKEKELAIKQLKRKLYDAKTLLEQDPRNEDKKKRVENIKSELREAKGKLAKRENSPAPQNALHVQVSGPDGSSRTATGFSASSSGRPRARK